MYRPSSLLETIRLTYFILLKWRYMLTVILCIGLMLFFNSGSEIAQLTRNKFSSNIMSGYGIISSPFVSLLNTSANIFGYFSNINGNKELQDKIAELELENVKLKIEVDDARRLKQEVNLIEKNKSKVITAKVITINSSGLSKIFALDLGSSSGIKVGDVACSNNTLIGKVITVYEDTSVIQSVTDSNAKIPAVASHGGQRMIVSGNGAATHLLASLYSSTEPPEDGDLVITSGDGGVYPYGLIIGRAKLAGSNVIIQPDSAVSNISYVTVILQ